MCNVSPKRLFAPILSDLKVESLLDTLKGCIFAAVSLRWRIERNRESALGEIVYG